jgi:NTE family protein
LVFEGIFARGRNGDRSAEATTAQIKPAATRPSIGLALGGGAARGFAHIGVMRTLVAHGIVPDVIVGTSIGAVVGGCYAARQLDTLETWARGLTVRGVLGNLDINLSGSGLIRGSHLAARLQAALPDIRIDDLPLRFAAIATEFNTGHEIWLTRGRLSDALRASYALPGIFPPVRIGGRWLVDGALVNPVPVSAARALGARLVIAVNLNSDLFGRGTIIASHGSDEEDEEAAQAAKGNGLLGLFGGERSLRRQFIGRRGRPSIASRAHGWRATHPTCWSARAWARSAGSISIAPGKRSPSAPKRPKRRSNPSARRLPRCRSPSVQTQPRNNPKTPRRCGYSLALLRFRARSHRGAA